LRLFSAAATTDSSNKPTSQTSDLVVDTPETVFCAPLVQTCDLFSTAATTMDSSNSVSLEEQTKLSELTSAKGTSQLSNFHQKKECTHPANIEHYLFAVVAEHARNQHRQILQDVSAAEIWQMSEMAGINVILILILTRIN
jgi:hypothetical protein